MINVGGGGAAFAAPMIKRVKARFTWCARAFFYSFQNCVVQATFKNARASTGYGLTAAQLFNDATVFSN